LVWIRERKAKTRILHQKERTLSRAVVGFTQSTGKKMGERKENGLRDGVGSMQNKKKDQRQTDKFGVKEEIDHHQRMKEKKCRIRNSQAGN